jgi:hypothetical protein
MLNSEMSDIHKEDAEVYDYNNIVFYVFRDANIIRWEHDGHFYDLFADVGIINYIEMIVGNIM